ncbi:MULTISPECIES: GNAT family N-acetyltransferase [unclassified Mucilaginibacter]|uniref:GNAT family N-acetyltransferase n=1 Tax=unclassified Mucilaginibacter TaxID=2617802 RepID=UPI002AC89FA4|nr:MULTISPECIES: GNAT family N-acetyltransferase [unclassified Mucilaginibacter]MEB0263644.1 GNAT family N-acetyltransferase [Mucilaginibacter sp. 10I4]MEB0277878.1 GNAT family N-acetyltransferase [Mucilaginibacter sp. 10B2]MEB0300575.1 GNAT family N-acetyltransferase [Mucilaginibacter sp. 5C4]WPX22770.1 GNAT family N-acetyltransferase [Mucilaginibacter sp. 5C4]
MPSKIEVKPVNNPADLETAFAIRHEVFVIGQNCPADLERSNEEESHHFLVTVDGEPAGASRWRKAADGYKLERFAVLSKFRGFGVGQALVKAVLANLPADADYIYLNSQTPAVGLYERFGFEKVGPQFEEAGMMHYKMVLKK